MGRTRSPENKLPPHIHKKSGSYYFVTPEPDRRWIRLGTNLAESISTSKSLSNNSVLSDENRIIEFVFKRHKRTAHRTRTEFSIDLEDVRKLLADSHWKCEFTGIPFSFEKIDGAHARPWAPSIDRIDSSKGYISGNIRIVCFAVNLALSAWGDSVLRRIINESKQAD
jgi:hypothetical protein